jgi:hypothetical protein
MRILNSFRRTHPAGHGVPSAVIEAEAQTLPAEQGTCTIGSAQLLVLLVVAEAVLGQYFLQALTQLVDAGQRETRIDNWTNNVKEMN